MGTQIVGEIDIKCLGRNFSPGDLYDARNDKLLKVSLWNEDKLREGTVVVPTSFTDSFISTTDTQREKLSVLKVLGETKLNLCSGLLDVGGVEASYIRDSRSKKNIASVILQYYTEVESRKLNMSLFDQKRRGFDHPNLISKYGEATHVVMQTTNGARALFQFDHEVDDESQRSDVMAKVSFTVGELFGVRVQWNAEKESTLREVVQKLQVTFLGGGVALDSPPTTYEEAIAVYKDLPSKN